MHTSASMSLICGGVLAVVSNLSLDRHTLSTVVAMFADGVEDIDDDVWIFNDAGRGCGNVLLRRRQVRESKMWGTSKFKNHSCSGSRKGHGPRGLAKPLFSHLNMFFPQLIGKYPANSFYFCTLIMDPSALCRAFFFLGTAVDIGGTLIPSFREQIMNYGSRGTKPPPPSKGQNKQFSNLFEYVASIQVPHTWFTHYYVVSVASSIFWGYQIYTRGRLFEFLAFYSQPKSDAMTVNQVILAWSFMVIQGARRLYESLTLTKPSQSKMWVGLWIIGIAYYVFMGLSVWIEGIGESERNKHLLLA